MFLFPRIIGDSLVFSSAAFSFRLDEIIVRAELTQPNSIDAKSTRNRFEIHCANVDEKKEF